MSDNEKTKAALEEDLVPELLQSPAVHSAFTPCTSHDWGGDVGQLVAALARAQKKFVDIEKNQRAKISGGKANYSYSYADLSAVMDAIRKPLAEEGLVVMQFPLNEGDMVGISTVCFHQGGGFVRNTVKMTSLRTMPQDTGIVLTYARRYGVSALLALAAGEADPDGRRREDLDSEPEPAAFKLSGIREASSGKAWIIKAETGHEYVTDSPEVADECSQLCIVGTKVDIKWETRSAKSGAPYRHVLQVTPR